jgi:Domain of unknown function (DUF4203)
MLPISYELPAAIALILGGAVACFAGYRLFRVVIAIYGFIAGAMIGSSTMGSSNSAGMLVAALFGGLMGAVLLFFAYFVGIALIGAGLGVVIANAAWVRLATGDPPWLVVLIAAAIGTVVALVLQRYVIVLTTAFSGAWTVIIGVLAMMNRVVLPTAASPSVWILYPFTPIGGVAWTPIVWIVLGVIGMMIQFATTGKR